MIIDNIENLNLYASLHPLMEKAIQFLQGNDMKALEPGRYTLVEDLLYVNVDMAKAKTKEEAKLEAHRKFIDIQLPLTTDERMGYTPLNRCSPANSGYNEEKDIIFFESLAETYLHVVPGMFTIFFPQDAHAPCVMETENKKIIVKMAVQQ